LPGHGLFAIENSMHVTCGVTIENLWISGNNVLLVIRNRKSANSGKIRLEFGVEKAKRGQPDLSPRLMFFSSRSISAFHPGTQDGGIVRHNAPCRAHIACTPHHGNVGSDQFDI